ncbi:MAG TPA: hypothetical protein VGK56_01350, partial [Anaerolineales bacterium]
MNQRYLVIFGAGTIFLCLFCGLAYNVPPIHDRLAWRVDGLRMQVKRFINPPEEVVFVPQEPMQSIADATLTALAPVATQTPLPALTETPLPSPTASLVPTPIPASASLTGI